MREIKFRVWNSISNEYRSLSINANNHNLGLGFVVSDGIGSNVTTMYRSVGDTVEQYTGIKDIDGKDIYVGDIVQPVRVMEVLTETVVQPLADKPITVKDDTYVNSKWIARSVGDTGFSVEDYYFSNELQIIGNIHHNPELLE